MVLIQIKNTDDSEVGLYAFPDGSDPKVIIEEWEEALSEDGHNLDDFLELRGVQRYYCDDVIYIDV